MQAAAQATHTHRPLNARFIQDIDTAFRRTATAIMRKKNV